MGCKDRFVDGIFPSRSRLQACKVVVLAQYPCYVFSAGGVKVFESRERGTFHVSLSSVISFWSELFSWDEREPVLKYLSNIEKLLSESTFKFPCSFDIKLPSMFFLLSEDFGDIMF